MLNSKYSKLLTALLIIAIIIIIGIVIYVIVSWYKTYTTETGAEGALEEFEGYINSTNIAGETNPGTNITIEDPENDNSTPTIEEPKDEALEEKPKYEGFDMVGKIEIPKTDVEYPVLDVVTPKSLEVAVAVLYGPGINEVGNTVIIGHNFRNGTFFSDNNKLEIGDKIYLTDLDGDEVTYIIYKKYITTTDDFEYATRDTNGLREISLSTCTDDSNERIIIWAKEE